jgi:hypothetical protein
VGCAAAAKGKKWQATFFIQLQRQTIKHAQSFWFELPATDKKIQRD